MRDDAVLRTTRLILRPTTADDVAGIAIAGGEASIRSLPWFGNAFESAWAVDWVKRARQEWEAGRNRTLSILDVRGAYLGSVNLGPLKENAMEVAYWILPDARRKGIATEAVCAVLNWARESFPGVKLWAKTRIDNVASQKVLSKCGFRERARSDFAYFDWAGPSQADALL